MIVESYSFGNIVIDGRRYSSDVIVTGGEVHPWWRKQGHRLSIEDLEKVIESKPEHLVIGTGSAGLMIVPESISSQLKKLGIRVYCEKTARAVEIYNELLKSGKTTAFAVHLTC